LTNIQNLLGIFRILMVF